MLEKCFAVFEWIWYPFERLGVSLPKKLSSICTAWAIRLEKIVVRLNSLGYPVQKKNQCHPFEQLGLSVWKKIVICSNGLGYPFQKIVIRLNGLGYLFQKIVIRLDGRAIRLKKKYVDRWRN